jgi:hypothetical protein
LDALLRSLLGPGNTSLSLGFNEYKGCNRSLVEEIEMRGLEGIADMDWVSDVEREKALATDSCWELT